MTEQPAKIWKRLTKKLQRKLGYFRSEIAFAAAYRKINGIEGLLVKGQERWLFDAARSLPRRATIVEIGAYLGKSTACLALGCKGTETHIFSIDLFGGVYDDVRNSLSRKKFDRSFLGDWQKNMGSLGVLKYVTPIQADSKQVAKSWKDPIHMLFIDGSHKFEDVIDDFRNFFPYVVNGGIVGIHDVTPSWPGPYKAWHEIIVHCLTDVGYCASIGYGKRLRGGVPDERRG
jgi:predicted O-methyltransferase YrrM